MKSKAAISAVLALAACSADQPRVIQTSANTPEIFLKPGMATQIEVPDNGHVQNVTVGNADLVTAQQADDVVNVTAKGSAGETNLIIRAKDDSGHSDVYQYHVTVKAN